MNKSYSGDLKLPFPPWGGRGGKEKKKKELQMYVKPLELKQYK